MHATGLEKTRETRVKQVVELDPSVFDFSSYVPIGKAVEKLTKWSSQGVEICYISSHGIPSDVAKDKRLLKKYDFPQGDIFYCKGEKSYKDIIEQIKPTILIEDDCESIGGPQEMAITFVKPEMKKLIKSVVVKEFEGVDNLPDDISALIGYT